jgi:hypothetical protein
VKVLLVGTTTGNGESDLVWVGQGSNCILKNLTPTAPITVFDVAAFGKTYIFVGSDPNVLNGNQFQVANGAGNALPQPPGGTCCAASSDPSDTVTQIGQNPPDFQFKTFHQSTAVSDRKLAFEYDLPNGNGTAVQLNVTARKFSYLTNNNPSNTCTLGYGTSRTYVYNVYTHPDHAPVQNSDSLQGTAVTESFSPPLSCAVQPSIITDP